MAEVVQIVEHKGKKIVFFDCRNLHPDRVAELFPEVTRIALENKINRVCSDVTNSSTNDNLKKAAAESSAAIKADMGSLHSALVGIRGVQRIIAQAIVKDQYFAKTMEEALDHLASKD